MARYTVEDIEIIRQKSGISYEEAVNLLEYHNGSLARSLVDLEKNGRLKKGAEAANSGKGIFNFLYRLRLKVTKNKATIVNLSSLFMLITLLVAPHLCLIGLVAALVMGYNITIERNSRDFENDSFDTIVKNAKSNVQSTVSGIAGVFTQEYGKESSAAPKEAAAPEEPARPAPEPRSESAASGTRPVNVRFSEGERADVKPDSDGYYEMDIK